MYFSTKHVLAFVLASGAAVASSHAGKRDETAENIFVPRRRHLKAGKGTPAPEEETTKKPKSCKGSCAPSEMPSSDSSDMPSAIPSDSSAPSNMPSTSCAPRLSDEACEIGELKLTVGYNYLVPSTFLFVKDNCGETVYAENIQRYNPTATWSQSIFKVCADFEYTFDLGDSPCTEGTFSNNEVYLYNIVSSSNAFKPPVSGCSASFTYTQEVAGTPFSDSGWYDPYIDQGTYYPNDICRGRKC